MSDNWKRLQFKSRFFSPGTTQVLNQGITGTVQENGVVKTDDIPDTLVLVDENAIAAGTVVNITLKNGFPYCKSKEEVERGNQERAQEWNEEVEKRRENRKEKRRDFYTQYDIPIEFTTAQNNRISQLRRGTTGSGDTPSTVQHFLCLEEIDDGRLNRDEGEFLCRNEGKWSDPEMGLDKKTTDPPEETRVITCKTCRKRMERWRTEE